MISKLKNKYSRLPEEVKASFWFLLCAFLQRGIAVITTPIFTRLMTPEEYGGFSVFYSWYGIITIIITLNLFGEVYTRGLVTFDKDKEIFTSSMQSLMLTLVLIWAVIYFIFHDFINSALGLTSVQMLCMFLIIWSYSVFNFWSVEQRVKVAYKRLTALSTAVVVLVPFTQVIFVRYMEDKVNARIFGLVLVYMLFYPLLFVRHMRKGKTFYSAKVWKYALAFNIPLIPHYLSQTVLNGVDKIMIERMVGPGEAGIYSLANAISQIMMIFNSSLIQAFDPWMYKKLRNGEAAKLKKLAYPALILIAVLNLGLIALAPELVAFFAPPRYMDAVRVIPPAAMSVYFSFLYSFFVVFEFYYQKTQYITAATLSGALLSIALNYIFISMFGYQAAGYVRLICFIFFAAFHYFFMRRLIRENLGNMQVFDIRVLLLISAVFTVSGFVLLMTYDLPYVRYGIILIMMIAVLVNYRKILNVFKSLISMRAE